MSKVPITFMGYRCERCGHAWLSRDDSKEPIVCPKCKSPYWNSPKRQTEMSYEEFRDKIKAVLVSVKTPLTWDEVRTMGNLPQKLPNIQWVHMMYNDIKLRRVKDKEGIIRWNIG